MSLAIDTNVFIYAHFPEYKESAKVRSVLEKSLQSSDLFYLSWQVIYEYCRLVTHPKILQKPLSLKTAMADMRNYLNHPSCVVLRETETHLKTMQDLAQKLPSLKGNLIHDLHYATILKEHSVAQILTSDADFLKFQFLDVINPLVEF